SSCSPSPCFLRRFHEGISTQRCRVLIIKTPPAAVNSGKPSWSATGRGGGGGPRPSRPGTLPGSRTGRPGLQQQLDFPGVEVGAAAPRAAVDTDHVVEDFLMERGTA